MTGCVALIVAAGRGARFGGDVPKQYLALAGEPVLRRTIRRFLTHERISAVRVVIDPIDRGLYDAATAGFNLLEPVPGGATRQESVGNGLESLTDLNPDHVLIHDAARPFVPAATIAAVIDALATHDGAIAAVPVQDTLKRVTDTHVTGTLDRTGLCRAQTPQGFCYPAIVTAHRTAAGRGLTDDAAVAEAAGLDVAVVPGSEDNFKITTESDLHRAERLLALDGGSPRIGLGFDVHRFVPGDSITLCGIVLPHDARLAGHSDADVGLHALTDAVLGALGAGDIGSHFPPGDPQWRGTDSSRFLRHAATLVEARNGSIVHVDVTLICERPKIGPYRERMATRIADILGIAPSRVSVKATTTEGLGFTGRGEGIAAQAVATVRLPD